MYVLCVSLVSSSMYVAVILISSILSLVVCIAAAILLKGLTFIIMKSCVFVCVSACLWSGGVTGSSMQTVGDCTDAR